MTPSRPAAWLRGLGAVGRFAPLFLVQDLGVVMTCPRSRLCIEKPIHLPDDIETEWYLAFLIRVARLPLMMELSAWGLSDSVVGVLLARIFEGVDFPEEYKFPGGFLGIELAKRMDLDLGRADPASIWRNTDPGNRPELSLLIPPDYIAAIQKNILKLDGDELRFLHRYGPRMAGAPDACEMFDLFNLTGLPPIPRLAMSQMLRLVPGVSDKVRTGGTQTYPTGGYEGITRKGGMDSLLTSELAYPKSVFYHRVLNGEALYYGREGEPDRRKELAYIITQCGLEMLGDYSALARGLTLALSQAMQSRKHDVMHSFAGCELTPPEGMNRPGDVHRVLYQSDEEAVKPNEILEETLSRVRSFGEKYRGIQLFWVLSEFWDADNWDIHRELYEALKSLAGQQAWFIRCGSDESKVKGRTPEAAPMFHRHHVINTELLWVDREPPTGDYFDKGGLLRIRRKRQVIELRREPMEVATEDAESAFGLKPDDETYGFRVWRPIEYVKNEYETFGDIVIDHTTGLTWQQSGSDGSLDYKDARAYVSGLNNKRFAGYADWRLPTVDELASLLEPEKQSQGLYIDPVFDERQRWCWTSDQRAGGGAWYVDFNDGSVYWYSVSYYVRVCRV